MLRCTSATCLIVRGEAPSVFVGMSPYPEDWAQPPSEPEVVRPTQLQATVYQLRPKVSDPIGESGAVQRNIR